MSHYNGMLFVMMQDGNNYTYIFDNSPEILTLKVLVATTDAQWEGMGDVGSARYEPALLPPYPTIRVLSYSNKGFKLQ